MQVRAAADLLGRPRDIVAIEVLVQSTAGAARRMGNALSPTLAAHRHDSGRAAEVGGELDLLRSAHVCVAAVGANQSDRHRGVGLRVGLRLAGHIGRISRSIFVNNVKDGMVRGNDRKGEGGGASLLSLLLLQLVHLGGRRRGGEDDLVEGGGRALAADGGQWDGAHAEGAWVANTKAAGRRRRRGRRSCGHFCRMKKKCVGCL